MIKLFNIKEFEEFGKPKFARYNEDTVSWKGTKIVNYYLDEIQFKSANKGGVPGYFLTDSDLKQFAKECYESGFKRCELNDQKFATYDQYSESFLASPEFKKLWEGMG